MSVKVSIPSAFRRHTEGLESYDCAAKDLNELLDGLANRFPELKPHLRDEQGKVRRFLNVYVNDEDIRFLAIRTSTWPSSRPRAADSFAPGWA